MEHDLVDILMQVGIPNVAGGLQQAYAGAVPYERDGLLLLHKEGHYHAGHTPLALLWKDAACSRYVIDTDAKVHLFTRPQDGHLPQARLKIFLHQMSCMRQ